ncbi:MAG: copper resistance system multicopper oxidase [Micropepsaceae bacterium]
MVRQVTFFLFCALSQLVAASAQAGEYNLSIGQKSLSIGGIVSDTLTINGQIPGPTLRFTEGEDVTIHVSNSLDQETSLHWHGILLPGQMDGVPGLNAFRGIAPGETYTYRFTARQSGTYWYHSHSGTQEQAGIYGPLIIDPKDPDPVQASQDYVVMLSDFTDTDGMEILRNLKNDHEYYNRGRRTVADFFKDLGTSGLSATLKDRKDWGEMRMDPTDLSDVSGYTFLMNGRSTEDNWTGIFQPGQRVRLRFINGSSMSYMDVRIPGLRMIVVQADGQNVEPVPVDEFRIAPAETYDVIVTPKSDKPYAIFAEPIDRTGSVRGTLAPRAGMMADIPPARPRAILSMNDMGMSHDMNSSHDKSMPAGMDMSHSNAPQQASVQQSQEHDHTGSAANVEAASSPPPTIILSDGLTLQHQPVPGP